MRVLKKSIWPYQVTLDEDDDSRNEKALWLMEHTSHINSWNMVHQSMYNTTTWTFKKETDMAFFLLRWQK